MMGARIRPGRHSLVAMAALSLARTHAATPVQLFGRDEPECQICGQRGHCSAECPRGMTSNRAAGEDDSIGMIRLLGRRDRMGTYTRHPSASCDQLWKSDDGGYIAIVHAASHLS